MASITTDTATSPLLADRYELLSPLGSGAAANVFRVRDLRTGAVRAAKVLKTELADNPEVLARFEDEFRILRTLHHPHLPEVYDYGWTAEGGRFLVMELVDGEPLDRYFRAHPEDIWTILYELCEVLVFVHARNLLHQDIKPSNILVTRTAAFGGERPLIKLIDFGLTHRRGAGAAVRLVGTAEYIAPEVVRGEQTLTRAVDYYSLGATLFELLCGAPPFVGTESQVLRAHLEREPVIEHEELEWAELYPHVRALLTKNAQARLVAFEEFRRAVVARATGGIEELDRAYALARIDSLGMIGKKDAWDELLSWLDASVANATSAHAHTFSISGGGGLGKRFLTGSLRAEASIRGIRTMSPAEVGFSRRDVSATRQPALMWSRLLEACEKEPVVLVVERPLLLPDEERSFVRLAGTQWELSRSRGRVLPLFFLVAVDSTTEDAEVLDYLPSDSMLKLDVPSLSERERDEIVAAFRGAMFDSRDAHSLSKYLNRFDHASSAVQGLQQAVLRSALIFAGQRWKAQPSLLTVIEKSKRNDTFSKDLVAALSPLEQRIVAILAAHPDPVPLRWIAEFVQEDASVVLSVVGGAMKRLCLLSSDLIAPANSSVGESLRAGSDLDDMRYAHEFLVAKLSKVEPRSIGEERALAFHFEQVGAVRDAAHAHIRLLRSFWSTRPRERPYELIEGICRSGLELMETHGKTIKAASRRHLYCFYLKEWIRALWDRNLFTHAKPIIDEWTARLGETMPAPLTPRYVRSVLELEGAISALAVLSSLTSNHRLLSKQLSLRLDLERALALHNSGNYQEALNRLDAIEDDTYLSTPDRYRKQIYRAMNLDELHGMGAIQNSMDALAEPARRAGCIDEAVLIRAMRARANISRGNPDAVVHEVARGIRIAHRSGLHFRENLLYRLAASAYGDMNDFKRSSVCQQRALTIAGVIGVRYMVATSWARLAQNESALGRFGNALNYSERAIALMGDEAPNRDLNQAYAAFHEAVVLSRVGTERSRAEIARRAVSSRGHNERGYFNLWSARDLYFGGKPRHALRSFVRARLNFEAAGFPLNAAWAGLGMARLHLDALDRPSFENMMGDVRRTINDQAPALFQFELRVIELRARYLFRSEAKAAVSFARECETLTGRATNVPLKIEMLTAVFRTYARAGLTRDAERVFDDYRGLVSEVLANADPAVSTAIAEEFSLGNLIEEYKVVRGRKRRGGPV